MEVIQKTADVLVIGGGQAALRAAIEAKTYGADVAVVAKGRAGFGGSSVISDGVHSQIFTKGDSPDIFFEDMVKAGRGVGNQRVMRIIADECTGRVEELGKRFNVETRQETEVSTPGHSFPRRVYAEGGRGGPIVRKLRRYAEEIGVKFYDRFQAVDLIQRHARVSGAIFIGTENILLLQAGSTILATGGLGGLYNNSDNPSDVTGEGLAMAWRHGARLENLEFIQFYPYRLIHPVNIDVYTKIFGKGAIMRNKDGVRFMDKYPKKELETRDVLSYEMFKQGTVYLDIANVPEEVIQTDSAELYRQLKKGYRGDLIMSPVQHYTLGGLQIDEHGRTTVKGLYACGECTSIHGANRLGGGAITDALVIGARAGTMAQEEADLTDVHAFPSIDESFYDPIAFKAAWQSEALSKIRLDVKKLMWEHVGIERTTAGLERAVNKLAALKETVDKDASLAEQVMNDLLQVAYFTALSAAKRKESRGAHKLVDIPDQKSEWNGKWIISGEQCDFQPI